MFKNILITLSLFILAGSASAESEIGQNLSTYLDGKTIAQEKQIPLVGEWTEHRLDVSQLSPGLYYVSLNTGREILTRRFMKIGN